MPPCMPPPPAPQTYGKAGMPPNEDMLALIVTPLHSFLYPLNN